MRIVRFLGAILVLSSAIACSPSTQMIAIESPSVTPSDYPSRMATSTPGPSPTSSRTPAVTPTACIAQSYGMTPTPTPVPDYNVPRLTVETLENGTYYVPGMDEEVTLTDGQWINEVTKTYSEFVSISDIAFGDLNGDGVEDAAIALYEHAGVSGHFQSLLVIINRNGVPIQSANRFVGGSVRRMAVRNGQIELEKIAYDGDDPNCCPSLPAVEKIQFLSEGNLVVRWASSAPEGNPREIRILSPNNGTMVVCAVRVAGTISYSSGSRHLRYRIQNSAGEVLSTGGFFIDIDGKDEVVAFDALIDVQDVPGEGPVLLSIAHNDVENNFEEVDSVDLIIG